MQCRLIVVPSLPTVGSDNDDQRGKAKQYARRHAFDERAEIAANQEADIPENTEDNTDDTDDEHYLANIIVHVQHLPLAHRQTLFRRE